MSDADRDALRSLLSPYARAVAELDLTDAERAQALLNERWPASTLAPLRKALIDANDAGWLTPKRATPELTFGRVSKPLPELGGCSIDAVDMTGAGAPHTHPNGEVSLCFATHGAPRFMGFPEGWVVAAAGSRHVPTVTDGRMVIVYFLPGGAMVWDS
ncbi:MAG: DUF4863 family protein [Myxococcota bacterium]